MLRSLLHVSPARTRCASGSAHVPFHVSPLLSQRHRPRLCPFPHLRHMLRRLRLPIHASCLTRVHGILTSLAITETHALEVQTSQLALRMLGTPSPYIRSQMQHICAHNSLLRSHQDLITKLVALHVSTPIPPASFPFTVEGDTYDLRCSEYFHRPLPVSIY